MSKFPDVRIATEADRPEVLRLCRDLHLENGMFPLEEERVNQILDKAFLSPHPLKEASVGVVGAPGEVKACICLSVQNLWYSSELFVNEMWNFVGKDYRQSDYALQLIEFSKAFADAWQMQMVIGILSNERTEAKTRLYRRHFRMAGAYFLYDPRNPALTAPSPIDERETSDRRLAAIIKSRIAPADRADGPMTIEQITEAFTNLSGNEARRIKTILLRSRSAKAA